MIKYVKPINPYNRNSKELGELWQEAVEEGIFSAVKLWLLFQQDLAFTANYGFASHVRKHVAGKKVLL